MNIVALHLLVIGIFLALVGHGIWKPPMPTEQLQFYTKLYKRLWIGLGWAFILIGTVWLGVS